MLEQPDRVFKPKDHLLVTLTVPKENLKSRQMVSIAIITDTAVFVAYTQNSENRRNLLCKMLPKKSSPAESPTGHRPVAVAGTCN